MPTYSSAQPQNYSTSRVSRGNTHCTIIAQLKKSNKNGGHWAKALLPPLEIAVTWAFSPNLLFGSDSTKKSNVDADLFTFPVPFHRPVQRMQSLRTLTTAWRHHASRSMTRTMVARFSSSSLANTNHTTTNPVLELQQRGLVAAMTR